jgi:LuxR family quorum sensing-dependent transcriptional regulator
VRQFTFDCVERLTSSTTLEGVAAELKRAGEALGFESFCISGLPPPGEPVNPYLMLSGWPEGWHHRYAEMGYVHADPVARLLRRTTMPFQWSEAFYRPDDLEARRVMDESVEFGLVQGFAVPIHTPEGLQAGVTFGARHMDLSRDERSALHLIAIYAHGQARSFLRPGQAPGAPQGHGLSPREAECLRWAASGKTTWEISVILGLSQRTIEEYFGNAALKLGAVNRVQAVAEALRRKIIV